MNDMIIKTCRNENDENENLIAQSAQLGLSRFLLSLRSQLGHFISAIFSKPRRGELVTRHILFLFNQRVKTCDLSGNIFSRREK
jgi:hypothetical protein